MMQSAQHGSAAYSMASRKLVSMLGLGRQGIKRGRDTRSQAHLNTAVIVMAYPPLENVLQMPLSQRNEKIQALPTDRSHQAFATGICLGRLRRRPQCAHAHSGHGFIQFLGENAVTVVDRKRNG